MPGYRSLYLRLAEDVPEGELRCGILSGQSQLEGPQEKGRWAEGRASCRESVMRLLMGSFPPPPHPHPQSKQPFSIPHFTGTGSVSLRSRAFQRERPGPTSHTGALRHKVLGLPLSFLFPKAMQHLLTKQRILVCDLSGVGMRPGKAMTTWLLETLCYSPQAQCRVLMILDSSTKDPHCSNEDLE